MALGTTRGGGDTPVPPHPPPPQIQDVVPINSYDAAGTFLLLGCNNGSIYYVGEEGLGDTGGTTPGGGGRPRWPAVTVPAPVLQTSRSFPCA